MRFKAVQRQENIELLQSNGVICSLSDVSCNEVLQPGGRAEKVVFLADGTEVTLQVVNVLTTGTATLELEDGTLASGEFSVCERYFLCAPPGTIIDCQITDFRCSLCETTSTNGETTYEVSVFLCQDVKVEASVNVNLEAPFCTPREPDVSGQCTPLNRTYKTPVIYSSKDESISSDFSQNQVESFCIHTSQVYDWVQNSVETSTLITIERVCLYEVLTAGEGCEGIIAGDLVCLPCDAPCEELLVCIDDQPCALVLQRTGEECVICPEDAVTPPAATVCEIPDGRVLNVDQAIFYQTIEEAVEDANPGDELIAFPGEYTPPSFLAIDKPLTLRGLSAEQTRVVFSDSLINTTSLRIEADNVTIDGIHFIGPTAAAGDNALLAIPFESFGVVYENITISNSILEGGRRNALIRARNLSLVNNTFIHTGNADSLLFENAQGATNIVGNTFQGGAASRAAMTFEDGASGFDGSIVIEGNTMRRHTQFVLFNLAGFDDVSILVRDNDIDHEDRAGSSIIFIPVDFTEATPIVIENNSIINPNSERLAVYVDYRFGGASVPADDQIQVLNNFLDVATPWGSPTDTVDADVPVGYSENEPPTMSLDAFLLSGNIVVPQ
ncbi:hypothetical protein LF817_00960 [Halobacillus sp. A1]|uniref:hypothetical protein n=1 Tax=Halobacillus sp. A1 TaxID=2880262 RepID=UPI0020A65F04|nr:hypothetical protein [Halobacillus sp. A1]MCP3029901.1 hypothetical protein [Halobacillus sp. A1]